MKMADILLGDWRVVSQWEVKFGVELRYALEAVEGADVRPVGITHKVVMRNYQADATDRVPHVQGDQGTDARTPVVPENADHVLEILCAVTIGSSLRLTPSRMRPAVGSHARRDCKGPLRTNLSTTRTGKRPTWGLAVLTPAAGASATSPGYALAISS